MSQEKDHQEKEKEKERNLQTKIDCQVCARCMWICVYVWLFNEAIIHGQFPEWVTSYIY